VTAETQPHLIEVMTALAPFAALADVCNHFNKPDELPICSWRIDGQRTTGPTVGHVRKAHDVLLAAGADMPVMEVRIRGADEIIDDALHSEARLLLAHLTEPQLEKFRQAHRGGIEIMDRAKLLIVLPLLQRMVTLNMKVARAGAA
jgi:hypothetical protein